MLLGTITCCEFLCINTLCALQQTLPNSKSSIWAWNATAGRWSFIRARTWLKLDPLTDDVHTTRLQKTLPSDMYTHPQTLSGSSEKWCHGLIKFRGIPMMQSGKRQCGVTLLRTVLYTSHTHRSLVCFFTASWWSTFNGIWNFLKKHHNHRNAELLTSGLPTFPL